LKKTDETKELIDTGPVVPGNKLIDYPKSLNLQEQRLFLFLLSKLDPDDPENITFRISTLEFAKAIGIDSTTNIYRDIRKAIKNLTEKIITIHATEDDCKTITDISLLNHAKYWHGKGYADIKISKEVSPFLFLLHKEFTKYKLSQMMRLSSLYAIRVYEMLKKQEVFGKRTFLLDDLRNKLSIPDNKLKAFNDFRIHVLEIAKREINLKTDLEIDFEFMKSGRKITEVQFDIKSKVEKAKGKKTEKKNRKKVVTDKTAKIEKVEKIIPRKTGFMKIFQYLFEKEKNQDSDQ
jgi:plasmid replication initiation protein